MSAALPRFEPEALDAATLSGLDAKNFLVADPEVDLPCRLKLLPGSTTLFVMLNGAVDRTKPLPVFARWNWGKVLGGHVLAVCDPTLYLADQLRLGWFVGNRSIDPMKALLRTVERVRMHLGIADARVVFYGSSGGGFASMVAAASRPVGRAIVVNPQTDITKYSLKSVERVAQVFASGWTAQRCRDEYPLRWNALEAIAEAGRRQHDLRIVYAQNLKDAVHHERHYIPFCAATGAPQAGGLSSDGRMCTHVYSSPEGHGAEPPEIVRFFASDGLTHLNQVPVP
jgi:pimeloyl-ACP methyl ester carboxylesterase